MTDAEVRKVLRDIEAEAKEYASPTPYAQGWRGGAFYVITKLRNRLADAAFAKVAAHDIPTRRIANSEVRAHEAWYPNVPPLTDDDAS